MALLGLTRRLYTFGGETDLSSKLNSDIFYFRQLLPFVSLCFLIYESQLGWFLSLFPVHKLLLLLAWSSENLLELVVKLRGFGECGSTGILGTFRPSQSSGKKKKVFGELSSKNSYPSLPGHKKNQVHRARPTKPTATQLNMVSLSFQVYTWLKGKKMILLYKLFF